MGSLEGRIGRLEQRIAPSLELTPEEVTALLRRMERYEWLMEQIGETEKAARIAALRRRMALQAMDGGRGT